MTESTADGSFEAAIGRERAPLLSRLLPAVCLYWLVTSLLYVILAVPGARDLIGPDNDDSMRLVEVRDLLAGQGWFDLAQYRLGLEGGTLMHWSRFIDLPIAALIKFFSLFLSTGAAEGAAATVWPLLLIGPLLWALGLAGRRIGGVETMHIALGLGAIFVFTCSKFRPGSIDHHNVQLALTMWVTAMLVDRDAKPRSYALAGFAAAMAVAIGAETMPFVAVACACVAVQWAWHGRSFIAAAQAFGLSLTLTVTAAFLATVPPHAYAVVTCDNLSLGFYSLTALGGAGLSLAASLSRHAGRPVRFGLLVLMGGVLLLAAKVIAPQCLGDPLGNLDPLLVKLWLNGVSEARSLVAEIQFEPSIAGVFYAVGLFAQAVCIFRIVQGHDRELHLLLLVLIAAVWAVSLLQVRGAFFANLLSILPLSLLISDLRRAAHRAPRNVEIGFAYAATVLLSVPAVWGVAGILISQGFGALALNAISAPAAAEEGECGGADALARLNSLPKGVVAAPSNSGAEILRFTPHRALSGPYHRNQGGMLTELHIGLATPADAKAFLRGAGVTILAYCKSDPQTQTMMSMKKDGLYASLGRGKVPDYLTPVGSEVDGFRIFTVLPEGR
ncbi:hypothetical protein EPK99_13625 [Neorhizobium lilium]|uniref:Uncharacterized protein n=1 Tax=Neorhizobium lilium TaxID=2503024 RepID=A0A3S3RI78_9HYPH|nr:hypothetical protein [Neorhizobium lilium]RWX76713.1 hypothetical protein EPK99_13625 [Neorhizobium lilium]